MPDSVAFVPWRSNAPMSIDDPCSRASPRWSTIGVSDVLVDGSAPLGVFEPVSMNVKGNDSPISGNV